MLDLKDPLFIDIASFNCERFSPHLSEESQIKKYHYGAELAFWMSRELSECNLITSYPLAGDNSWYIECHNNKNQKHEFSLHCKNTNQLKVSWLLTLQRIQRRAIDFTENKPAEQKPILDAIHQWLFRDPQLHNVQWLHPYIPLSIKL
jgi:hypothetical protein